MEDAATVYRFLREDITPNLSRNIVPLSRHLQYPIEKAHNVTNVNACRQAEDQLDRLWKIIDAHFRKHTDKTLHEIFLSHNVKAREIHRTPEWTPPPKVSQPPNKKKETKLSATHLPALTSNPTNQANSKDPKYLEHPSSKPAAHLARPIPAMQHHLYPTIRLPLRRLPSQSSPCHDALTKPSPLSSQHPPTPPRAAKLAGQISSTR
jgi:hypothetical protein